MPFPPGSVWVCFSDQTSHAVMSGQFMLEQTFFLPVKRDGATASARRSAYFERLKGRALGLSAAYCESPASAARREPRLERAC